MFTSQASSFSVKDLLCPMDPADPVLAQPLPSYQSCYPPPAHSPSAQSAHQGWIQHQPFSWSPPDYK